MSTTYKDAPTKTIDIGGTTFVYRQLGMKTGVGFYDWGKRNGKALIERRDRQIVRQLEFLKKMDAL